MVLNGIRLVTFDATNTLLRFKVNPWQYYTIIGQNYGFKGSDKDLKPRLLDSYNEMWNLYPNFGWNTISWESWWSQVVKKTFDGQLPSNADVNSLASQLISDYTTTKCWCLAEGGNEIINILKKYKISVGVISNFDPRLINILQNLNIHKKFDFIITSFEVGVTKPNKEIFDYALQVHKGVIPEECLHIGDDFIKDYIGARQAGWHSWLVTEKEISNMDIARKHIFKNIKEVCAIMLKNKPVF